MAGWEVFAFCFCLFSFFCKLELEGQVGGGESQLFKFVHTKIYQAQDISIFIFSVLCENKLFTTYVQLMY